MCDRGGTELAFYVGGASALAMTALGAAAVKLPRAPAPARLRADPEPEQLAA
jgi:hypothetical protein